MSTRLHMVVLGLLAAIVLSSLAVVAWRFTRDEETTNRVTLSVDGVKWDASVEDAFFFSETAWTPGQTRSAIFWVRNDADVPADVDLHVAGVGGEDLTQTGVLEVSAALGDGDDVEPFDPGRAVNTVRVGTLEPGEWETVTLRAEHVGEADVDSALLRHQIAGSGTSTEEPDAGPITSEARLELAPFFLCVGLLVTLLVMRRSRSPRAGSARRW